MATKNTAPKPKPATKAQRAFAHSMAKRFARALKKGVTVKDTGYGIDLCVGYDHDWTKAQNTAFDRVFSKYAAKMDKAKIEVGADVHGDGITVIETVYP